MTRTWVHRQQLQMTLIYGAVIMLRLTLRAGPQHYCCDLAPVGYLQAVALQVFPVLAGL